MEHPCCVVLCGADDVAAAACHDARRIRLMSRLLPPCCLYSLNVLSNAALAPVASLSLFVWPDNPTPSSELLPLLQHPLCVYAALSYPPLAHACMPLLSFPNACKPPMHLNTSCTNPRAPMQVSVPTMHCTGWQPHMIAWPFHSTHLAQAVALSPTQAFVGEQMKA